MPRRAHVGAVRMIFQNDVIELRDVVQREVTDLDQTVTACAAKLDVATVTAWTQARAIDEAWIARVNAGVGAAKWGSMHMPPDWDGLYNEGRGLESILRQNWWPRLQSHGCVLPFAQPSAPREPGFSTDSPGNPLSILQSLEGIAKALVLVMVVREVRDWTR